MPPVRFDSGSWSIGDHNPLKISQERKKQFEADSFSFFAFPSTVLAAVPSYSPHYAAFMKKITLIICLILVCISSCPVSAWNNAGHMTVASIAYDRLTPKARSRVDAILKLHPAYPEWTAGRRAKSIYAFLWAARWPDDIKRPGSGFTYDAPPGTSPIPAYPDMNQHFSWHFINQPLPEPGVPVPPGFPIEKDGNIIKKINEMTQHLRTASPDDPKQAYYLAWLMHLVGDIHQPLHTAARISKTNPKGDKGGNEFFIEPLKNSGFKRYKDEQPNLHAYWDSIVSRQDTVPQVRALGRRLPKAKPSEIKQINPEIWAQEGFQLASEFAYSIGSDETPGVHPITPKYHARARQIGRKQVALAGYRLAQLLNEIYSE